MSIDEEGDDVKCIFHYGTVSEHISNLQCMIIKSYKYVWTMRSWCVPPGKDTREQGVCHFLEQETVTQRY